LYFADDCPSSLAPYARVVHCRRAAILARVRAIIAEAAGAKNRICVESRTWRHESDRRRKEWRALDLNVPAKRTCADNCGRRDAVLQ
jgi:hypothetical protein